MCNLATTERMTNLATTTRMCTLATTAGICNLATTARMCNINRLSGGGGSCEPLHSGNIYWHSAGAPGTEYLLNFRPLQHSIEPEGIFNYIH